jgi:hypothetical protein
MLHKQEPTFFRKTQHLQAVAKIQLAKIADGRPCTVSIEETRDLGKVVLTTNLEICRSLTTIGKCCCYRGVNLGCSAKLFEFLQCRPTKNCESFYEKKSKSIVFCP